MKIGFFASFNETAGGIFQYACSMINALRHRSNDSFIALTPPGSPLKPYFPENWLIVEVPSQIFTTNADRTGKMADNSLELLEKGCNSRAADFFRSFGIDILLFAAPEMISFESGLPYLMPFHDLQHRIQPHFPEVSALGTWQWREYLFGNGAKFADGILVDSETGKEDVLNYYGNYISAEKLFVLPLPPAYTPEKSTITPEKISEIKVKYRLPERYFFYPAQFWAHKNHARLIQSLHILRSRYGIDATLALVGSRTGGEQEAREKIYEIAMHLAEQLGVQDLCRYLGYVPDEDMPLLYAGATALVMPTMFGPTNTPVSEAWGLGCPVITSDIRGIREHAGEASLLADPNSADAIAETIYLIMSDDALRNDIIRRGKKKYAEYNPEHFAVKLNAAIDQTAAGLGIISNAAPLNITENIEIKSTVMQRDNISVSAIISTYKSEKFIRGALDDLLAQTLYTKGMLEVIVINSASPENEDEIIRGYTEKYPNIIYVKTPTRETIYEAWNRGVRLASGKYITNANTDDRHRADALEIMANALDNFPETGLVYADSFVTSVENDEFSTTQSELRYELPDFNLGTQLSGSCFGAQPMWRRSLHDALGYFDPQWKIAGDYEFFIRVARKTRAAHIRETLGLFLSRPDSVSGSDNARKTITETLLILRKYRTEITIEELYPELSEYKNEPLARAAALWDYGNLCALSPYRDFKLALGYYEKSLETTNLSEAEKELFATAMLNNGGVMSYCIGNVRQGTELLEKAVGKIAAAEENLQIIKWAERENEKLYPLHFRMTQFNHRAVNAARTAKGLMLTSDGKFVWSEESQQVFWDGYIGLDGVAVGREELERAKKMLPRIEEIKHKKKTSDLENKNILKKRPKRILMTMYGWDDDGGGTLLPRALAEHLVKQGFEVAVIYAGARDIAEKEAYYVHRYNEFGVELLGIYNRPVLFYDLERPDREIEDKRISEIFSSFLDEFKPDIIHFHNLFNLSIKIAEDAGKRNIPSVFTSHNYWIICPRLYLITGDGNPCSGPEASGKKCAECIGKGASSHNYAKRLEYAVKATAEYISLHIAPSSRAKEIFIAAGCYPDNIRVLRQASPVVDHISRCRKERKHNDILRLGFLGSVIPIKGAHILVEAAQQFGKQEIELHFYGGAAPQYAEILKKIDRKNLIRFHGEYSYAELPDILEKIDVAVAPSLVEETGGLTAVEALAAGIPVVASRIGGLTDAVSNGINGLLFAPGSVRELTEIIARLLNEEKLYGNLQKNAKPEKTFEQFTGELIEIYNEIKYAGI
ncbi:MAG: glycosyltransferase [Bacteroidetes bacterium]|nr:glycosyltransferase [Bacteroidota bacterium]